MADMNDNPGVESEPAHPEREAEQREIAKEDGADRMAHWFWSEKVEPQISLIAQIIRTLGGCPIGR